MRVAITNCFQDDNKGGALLTQASILLARTIDERATITLVPVNPTPRGEAFRHTIASNPDVHVGHAPFQRARGLVPGLGLCAAAGIALALGRRAPTIFRSLAPLADADLVISKGGYVFVNRRGPRQLMSQFLTTFPLLFGRRCGSITIAAGATVGPFENWYSRLLNRLILSRIHIVLPREEASASEAGALAKGMVRSMPDGVFAPLGVDRRARQRPTGHRPPDPSPAERYAVVAYGYPADDDDEYHSTLVRTFSTLVEEGRLDRVHVVLQVVDQQGNSSERRESQRLADAIDDTVPGRSGRVADVLGKDLAPEDLIALYGAAEFVTGRRLHASLFALIGGGLPIPMRHPTEPHKAASVYGAIGLPELVVDVTTPEETLRSIRSLLDRREQLAERTATVVEGQRALWSREAEAVAAEVHRLRSTSPSRYSTFS